MANQEFTVAQNIRRAPSSGTAHARSACASGCPRIYFDREY